MQRIKHMTEKEINKLLNSESIADYIENCTEPITIYIDDEIEGATYLDWRDLIPFQGDLKELSTESEKKLLISLIENGFFDIKKVWRNFEKKVIIADGHQTLTVFNNLHDFIEGGLVQLLRKSDNEPTTLIPCVFINARDEKDLARKLLVINSEYGVVTREGLKNFQSAFGIQDFFMENVAKFQEWQPLNVDWRNVPSQTWDSTPIENNAESNTENNAFKTPFEGGGGIGSELPPVEENPVEGIKSDNKEIPTEKYIELPFVFKKGDYDFINALIERVKIEQLFDKNSDAMIHIAKQYETYVGSI